MAGSMEPDITIREQSQTPWAPMMRDRLFMPRYSLLKSKNQKSHGQVYGTDFQIFLCLAFKGVCSSLLLLGRNLNGQGV
jgi:hypothetical protein